MTTRDSILAIQDAGLVYKLHESGKVGVEARFDVNGVIRSIEREGASFPEALNSLCALLHPTYESIEDLYDVARAKLGESPC
jgi:hypothetical protein